MIKEGYFNINEEQFYQRFWLPDNNEVKANILLIHGYGEHCARYDEMAMRMNSAGIAVYSYDQRGFGRSPGKRAWIDNFEQLLKDLDIFIEKVKTQIQGEPVFFMGHSMGGMVLARYVQTRSNLQANGLIFSSPFVAINEDVPKFLMGLAKILDLLLPWLPVASVDNTGLSKDPEVVKRADEDPLCYHGSVKAHTGYVFMKVIEEIHKDFAKINVPTIIVHGKKDRIVPYKGSVALYEGISTPDKTLKLFEDGYHELWNDYEKDEVIRNIIDWVLTHI